MVLKQQAHQTVSEEIVNALTHGVGAVLSIIGFVFLLVAATFYGGPLKIVSVAIYGSTLVSLYVFSTLYHSIQHGRTKNIFQILDHSAIYLLIAGSYTPFTLVSLSGGWGWTLFAIIWSLALIGLCFKLFFTGRYNVISTIVYIAMGWLAIIAIEPIVESIPWLGVSWLLAGGLCYSFGVIFFALDHKVHFTHAAWHLFVLAGSACHFIAIYYYVVIPAIPA